VALVPVQAAYLIGVAAQRGAVHDGAFPVEVRRNVALNDEISGYTLQESESRLEGT